LTVTSEADFKALVDQMEFEDYAAVDKKISFSSILNFQPASGQTDELSDKAKGLQRLIASHQAEIINHEKTIAELKRQLEQLREPMDDMFSAL
jgi:chromosome segregation ATPase